MRCDCSIVWFFHSEYKMSKLSLAVAAVVQQYCWCSQRILCDEVMYVFYCKAFRTGASVSLSRHSASFSHCSLLASKPLPVNPLLLLCLPCCCCCCCYP